MNAKQNRFSRLAACTLIAAMVLVHSATAADLVTSSEVKKYQSWVERLAAEDMQGRGPQTEGLAKARDCIIAQYKAMELVPAFGDSYTQQFPVPAGAAVREQSLATVTGQGKTKSSQDAQKGRDFSPMVVSGSGSFEGEVVFAGYSISSKARKYDNYADANKADVTGKVVLCLRYEPHDERGRSLWTRGRWSRESALTGKVSEAFKRGASAVLIVNPPAAADEDNGVAKINHLGMWAPARGPVLQVSRRWVQELLGEGRQGRLRFERLLTQANDKLTRPVALNARVAGKVDIRKNRIEVDNVAAVLKGKGKLADEVLIVGAHYDHIGMGRGGRRAVHPGADDNASGTAGVLTLARWFAKRWQDDGAPDHRTMVFVNFAGEELGLIGSRYLAGRLKEIGTDASKVAGMINLDMIGRLRKDKLGVWGVDSGDAWRKIVATANKSIGLELDLVSSGFGPSDHASFYSRKMPVLAINTGFHRDIHSPRDTADKINYQGAVKVLRLIERIAVDVATREDPVAYKAPKKQSGRPYVGILPGDVESGCGVQQVVPDGPAEKAGLQQGDVIVRWNDVAISSAAELLGEIRKHKPGDKVKLTVVRKGEKQVIPVELGQR